MKGKAGFTLVFTITCLLLGAFPAMAGEWRQTEEEQWQYIQDDGTKATGWLDLDGKRYYLDREWQPQVRLLVQGRRVLVLPGRGRRDGAEYLG